MIFDFMNGGMSYDAAGVVAATSQNLFWIVGACVLSFTGAYMQYFGALSMGFKHRTYSIPLICNLWNFAHDTTFVMNFHHWFYEVDFWLVRAFWFALVVFASCECVVMYQLLRYGRQEVFPGMSLVQATAAYLGLQFFMYGVFWWLLSMVHDPYYLIMFSTAVVLAPVLNIPLMRQRGSRKGFSMMMLVGYCFLCSGFWLWMLQIDSYFREPFVWMMALGSTGLAIAGVWVFKGLPEYIPLADGIATVSAAPVRT